MQDDPTSKNTSLSPEKKRAKSALLAECDKLAAAGVTFVAVHFDGCGDSGATEEVKCYDSEWYAWGDLDARKLTVERNDRFEDYTTTTYEV
jgi:hypothetical protein